MRFDIVALCEAAAAAIPAGIAAAFAARVLSAERVPIRAMIAACLAVFLWSAAAMAPGWMPAVTCAMSWALIVLATVDALALRLPDVLTLPLLAAGLAVAWFGGGLLDHAIGAAAGLAAFYGIAFAYERSRGQEGLGMGDVKLAGAMGAWLGWQALPFAILVACAVGLIWVGIGYARRGRDALAERIPFGVALCFALWFVWVYGVPAMLSADG